MEPTVSTAMMETLKLGFPGVVILGLAWAYFKKDKALTDSQESRIKDVREVSTVMNENTNATRAQTDAMRSMELVIRGFLK